VRNGNNVTATPINNTSANVDLSAFDGSKYCHAGLEPDSNKMAGGVGVGGTDKLVQRLGGADNQTDTGQSGGRELL
jgi:hypothetical protein